MWYQKLFKVSVHGKKCCKR